MVALCGALVLCALPPSAKAANPTLSGVRLGQHKGFTRVVVDFKGQEAPFSIRMADDGLSLSIIARAPSVKPVVHQHRLGVVRDLQLATVTNGSIVTIDASMPVSVLAQGSLTPDATYRTYRVYVDLVSGAAPRPPDSAAPAESPIAAVMTSSPPPEPAALPPGPVETAMAMASPDSQEASNTPEMPGEDHPDLTVKLGGAGEWSLHGDAASAGPTLALQKGVFGDRLEIEAGVTPLIDHGQTSWKSALIVKAPIALTEHLEGELGLGPLWLHKSAPDEQADSLGAEAVAELVFWPWQRHRLGWYVETGYGYDFAKGHERSVGAGGGILIGIP